MKSRNFTIYFILAVAFFSICKNSLAFDCNNVTDVPVSECLALNAMGDALEIGTSLAPNAIRLPWISSTETTVCDTNQTIKNQLIGLVCDTGHVTEIRMYGMALTGNVPSLISELTQLKNLLLGDNELTGSIPPELGNLTQLTDLYLNNNSLSGSIPSQLSHLGLLINLDLSGNHLAGSIPPQFGSLSQLEALKLSGNELSGSIPVEIGQLTNVLQISLSGNQLTGNIPVEIGGLQMLYSLRLSYNNLSGPIPTELAFASSLFELDLRGNTLTGNIPRSLLNMPVLSLLNLSENGLTGSIPMPDSPATSTMVRIYLSDNQLIGAIPPEMGQMSQLDSIWLHSNHLKGTIPATLGNLVGLKSLFLNGNQLSGEIPASLGNLSQLNNLTVYDNQLLGTFPDLSGTSINSINISNNCIDPNQTAAVTAWLDARTAPGNGLDGQNPVSDCKFYYPVQPDLISRNGFAPTFNNKELVTTGIAQDIQPDEYHLIPNTLIGDELVLTGNTWKMIPYPYEVTSNTTLQFIFKADGAEAEVNGVALARDVTDLGPLYYNEKMLWQVFGTQNVGIPVGNYALGDGYANYCIPVGQYMEGGISYLIFINDDDGAIQSNQSASYLIGILGENQCTPTP